MYYYFGPYFFSLPELFKNNQNLVSSKNHVQKLHFVLSGSLHIQSCFDFLHQFKRHFWIYLLFVGIFLCQFFLSPNFVNWPWGISELGNTFTDIPNLICFCFCFCFFFLPLSLSLDRSIFYAINDMMNPLSNKLGCLFKSLALPQNLCALIPRFSSIALDFTT